MGYFRSIRPTSITNGELRAHVEDRCLAKSDPDEPIFVLRAHDQVTPTVVQFWLDMAIAAGMNPHGAKAERAREWIVTMREWQRVNGAHVPD